MTLLYFLPGYWFQCHHYLQEVLLTHNLHPLCYSSIFTASYSTPSRQCAEQQGRAFIRILLFSCVLEVSWLVFVTPLPPPPPSNFFSVFPYGFALVHFHVSLFNIHLGLLSISTAEKKNVQIVFYCMSIQIFMCMHMQTYMYMTGLQLFALQNPWVGPYSAVFQGFTDICTPSTRKFMFKSI